jgi:hypothetical protein
LRISGDKRRKGAGLAGRLAGGLISTFFYGIMGRLRIPVPWEVAIQ